MLIKGYKGYNNLSNFKDYKMREEKDWSEFFLYLISLLLMMVSIYLVTSKYSFGIGLFSASLSLIIIIGVKHEQTR